jgi:hypothetical protein
MNVLVLDLLCKRVGHKHVVQLLGVHVEQIGVPLQLVDFVSGVCIREARNLSILLQRFDKGKLAKS